MTNTTWQDAANCDRRAFRDMLGQPPARVTSPIRRLRDLVLEPGAVELEELPGFRTEVGKLFLKRDHYSPAPETAQVVERWV